MTENRVGNMGTGGDVSKALVKNRNWNEEVDQEKNQGNVREERHLSKLFEFSLQDGQN